MTINVAVARFMAREINVTQLRYALRDDWRQARLEGR